MQLSVTGSHQIDNPAPTDMRAITSARSDWGASRERISLPVHRQKAAQFRIGQNRPTIDPRRFTLQRTPGRKILGRSQEFTDAPSAPSQAERGSGRLVPRRLTDLPVCE